MNFKTLLVETKVFCPLCNSELHIGNLMFEDESNGQTVCGYCRDDYETYILTGVLGGELENKRLKCEKSKFNNNFKGNIPPD